MPRASCVDLDTALRPHLGLAMSDPAVRRVVTLVHWFEEMAGLPLT
jgi:hypothetical protein